MNKKAEETSCHVFFHLLGGSVVEESVVMVRGVDAPEWNQSNRPWN